MEQKSRKWGNEMSICDNCIHDEVCGLEDNHEEAITFCGDMIPKDIFNKIRAEIDRQEKWLLQAGYTAYNTDIAFDSIKRVIAESEG